MLLERNVLKSAHVFEEIIPSFLCIISGKMFNHQVLVEWKMLQSFPMAAYILYLTGCRQQKDSGYRATLLNCIYLLRNVCFFEMKWPPM
uniref:Uncharacterized protein n=1 Tax=Pyxicephalus adspersus TaxID=30357 RepID=A0AAV3ABX1_PYXAD|nr:TPA: hypothetical protein GDO54_011067 [Pyxicephalus adspersus]